jgi:hypothetical protein
MGVCGPLPDETDGGEGGACCVVVEMTRTTQRRRRRRRRRRRTSSRDRPPLLRRHTIPFQLNVDVNLQEKSNNVKFGPEVGIKTQKISLDIWRECVNF